MYSLSATVFAPIAQAFTIGRVDLQKTLTDIFTELNVGADNRLPIDFFSAYRFFNEAFERTGNPDIGLEAYPHAWPGCLGVAGYAIMSSPDLGEALARLVKYQPLITDGWTIDLDRFQNQLKITATGKGIFAVPAPRCIIDVGAALIIGLIHWLVPQDNPTPIAMELPYTAPADTCHLEQLFGSNLIFNTHSLSLVFDDEICKFPLITASPGLQIIHCTHADALLDEHIDGSLTAQIRRALSEGLISGRSLTLTKLAGELGKNKRSLQTSLVREGLTFSLLQDECRRELAQRLLKTTEDSLKCLSIRLGFSNFSSFHKACHRWFGLSPGQFRDAARSI